MWQPVGNVKKVESSKDENKLIIHLPSSPKEDWNQVD
jgi:hypothetical protein